MFKRTQQRSSYIQTWGTQPVVGETINYGKISIKLISIDGDTLHWEQLPW